MMNAKIQVRHADYTRSYFYSFVDAILSMKEGDWIPDCHGDVLYLHKDGKNYICGDTMVEVEIH